MSQTKPLSIQEHFESLPDPRIDRQKRHNLIDIITITICVVLSGAEAWTHVEDFGKSNHEWFQSFLELPNGIPSHDTFGRFFSLLDLEAFQGAFLQWLQSTNDISIDGKCLRRSHDKAMTNPLLHGQRLGQAATNSSWDKSRQVRNPMKSPQSLNCYVCLRLKDVSSPLMRLDAKQRLLPRFVLKVEIIFLR